MKKFQRTIEDFACENCGEKIKGTGYTNHCPKCLFSRHVDVNPGDRAQGCVGLMQPVDLEFKSGHYILTHECKNCGLKTRCKTSPKDDAKALTALAETIAKNTMF